MINTLYNCVETALLTGVIIQLIYSLYQGARINNINLPILLFIVLWVVNEALFLFMDSDNRLVYNFVHTTMPLAFVLTLLLRDKYKVSKVLVLITGLMACNLFFTVLDLQIVVYIWAVALLVLEALRYSKKSSAHIKQSSLFLILAVQQTAAFLIFVLSVYPADWNASEYVGYLHIVILSIFITTLIMLNVKFRRFFAV